MKLPLKPLIIAATFVIWFVFSMLYGYQWVAGCMADRGCYDYEGIWVLPLLGFLLYRGPFLVGGLLIVIFLELVFLRDQSNAGAFKVSQEP